MPNADGAPNADVEPKVEDVEPNALPVPKAESDGGAEVWLVEPNAEVVLPKALVDGAAALPKAEVVPNALPPVLVLAAAADDDEGVGAGAGAAGVPNADVLPNALPDGA